MLRVLALASGTRGMAGGQAIDLAAVGAQLTLPQLEFMHILKTGALIRASVALGARCGQPLDETKSDQLDRYAKCVGLAFQVVDDVLDAEAPTATLGKTAGKDAAQGKPTYVSLLGIPRAKTPPMNCVATRCRARRLRRARLAVAQTRRFHRHARVLTPRESQKAPVSQPGSQKQ